MTLTTVAPGKTWKFLYWLQWGLLAGLTFQVARGPYGGHYGIFTQAGSYLLSSKNPYGVDWGYGGLWFYSPVFGWFFGVLNFLPPWAGVVVFNFLSHVFLLEGMRRYLKQLGGPAQTNRYLSLLILLGWGEYIGAYQHIRPEMMILGILLIVYDISFSKPVLAAGLGALIINLKMFPLAAVGLLSLIHLQERRALFPGCVLFFLGSWFALPFLVYDFDFAKSLYELQNQTLTNYVNEVYGDFYSVFGLLKHTFGIILPRNILMPILLGVAVLLSLVVWYSPYNRRWKLVFAASFGVLYTVNFNLLSQSSAFCLGTPALALCLFLCFAKEQRLRQLSYLVVGVYWMIVSCCFSDLVPTILRDLCRELRVKSLGSLIMMVFLIWVALRAPGTPDGTGEPVSE